MLVPPKGEFAMLPPNQEARRIAGTWDPAKEPADDAQCKGYGAAAIMRIPWRLQKPATSYRLPARAPTNSRGCSEEVEDRGVTP
jgi:hypothetical protein